MAERDRAKRELGVPLNKQRLGPPCDPTCPSTEMALRVRHNPQNRSFTCGNTAGVMIAHYLGRKRSRFNGARLREGTMGGRRHMRTYINKSTPWASKNFVRGLNRWVNGRVRGSYQQHQTPGVRRYKRALNYNIRHGRPFGASTIEYANGVHYNRHPDRLIGHWIVVRGYAKKRRRSKFLDPAANSRALPTFDMAHKRFPMNSRRMVRRFLRPNHGIAA